jgi:SOS-response transcriptional repressor LexA
MPAAVIPIGSQLRAEFAVLSLAPPGLPRTPFGVLLIENGSDALEWKLREDLDRLNLSPEDQEYVSYLDSDFRARVGETSGSEFLAWLEDRLSGFLLISEREAVAGRSLPAILNRLFERHVDSRVLPYKTHLPFYGLRAAATKFGEDSEVSEAEIEWVLAPERLRLTDDMFVVEVVGRSMEPLIPDGSRVIFRKIPVGSRQGKRVLLEERGALDTGGRFTVKRYTSIKGKSEDGEWAHAVIRLEPLNPEFPAFELDAEAFEGKYRVIGEFVQVLESDE